MSFVTRSVFDFLCLAGSWCTESDFGLHYKKYSYNSCTQRSHSPYAVYSLVQYSQSFSLRMSCLTLSTVKPIFNKNFLWIGSPRSPYSTTGTPLFIVYSTLYRSECQPHYQRFHQKIHFGFACIRTRQNLQKQQWRPIKISYAAQPHNWWFISQRIEKKTLLRARCTCG